MHMFCNTRYCWKDICFVSIKIPLVSNNNVAEHWEKIYSTFRIVISWSQTQSSFSIPVHSYSGLASLNIILHFMVEQSSNGGEWSEIMMYQNKTTVIILCVSRVQTFKEEDKKIVANVICFPLSDCRRDGLLTFC